MKRIVLLLVALSVILFAVFGVGIAPTVWSQCNFDSLYTFTGEGAYDNFGYSVSGAGDVNNDGYNDLFVGAPFNDAGGTDAGRAYVYSCQLYLCGDVNDDASINLSDVICLANYILKGGALFHTCTHRSG